MTTSTCIYPGTDVVIAAIDERVPHHDGVVKLLSGISGRKPVSRLTLIELTSVYSRADS